MGERTLWPLKAITADNRARGGAGPIKETPMLYLALLVVGLFLVAMILGQLGVL